MNDEHEDWQFRIIRADGTPLKEFAGFAHGPEYTLAWMDEHYPQHAPHALQRRTKPRWEMFEVVR